VESALDRLGVLAHFERLPEGLDTEVRERGTRLSAGERQLVALGRAALVDPAVLVLDEATSNLDPGTEAEVEAALERLMQGRTTIVVAHRLSTVQRADRIVVVDGAQLAEDWHPCRTRGTRWQIQRVGNRVGYLTPRLERGVVGHNCVGGGHHSCVSAQIAVLRTTQAEPGRQW